MANEGQRTYFADPKRIERWPTREPFTSHAIAPLLAIANLHAGQRVLDVGCGGGICTVAAAEVVGFTGRVVGADLSPVMIGLAESRPYPDSVTYLEADVQEDAIAGGPFDRIISQFGTMFFDNPVAAFTNLGANLAEAGTLTAAVWQGMEGNLSFMAHRLAARGFKRSAPPSGGVPQGPFAHSDRSWVASILTEAGFVPPTWQSFSLVHHCALDDVVTETMLLDAGIDTDRIDEAIGIARAELEPYREDNGQIACPLEVQIYTTALAR